MFFPLLSCPEILLPQYGVRPATVERVRENSILQIAPRKDQRDKYGRVEFLYVLSDCFRSPAEATMAEDDLVDSAYLAQVAFAELLVSAPRTLSQKDS